MIRTIHINNFKSLRDTGELSVGKLTILTGINGRGKSSFIQSLLLISQSLRESEGSPIFLFPNGDWCSLGTFSDLLNVYAPNQTIQIAFSTDANVEKDFVFEYHKLDNGLLGEATSVKVDGYETIEDSSESTAGDFDESFDNSFSKVRTTYRDLKELQKLQNVFFISADRQATKGEEDFTTSKFPNYIGAQGQRVLNVLSDCDKSQIQEVELLMNNIMDGATLHIERDDNKNRVYLFLDSVSHGHLYKPINVGFGYSYILSTILSLVISQPGDTIIIENPEAHLHPQAQARLMKTIFEIVKNKDIQVFIESHSDHIVNAALVAIKRKDLLTRKDVEILYFRTTENPEEGSKIENLDITEFGRVCKPPRGFCDQYAIDLREIMQPSYANTNNARTEN